MIASSFVLALLGLTPATVAGPLDWFKGGGGSWKQKRQANVAVLQDSIGNITTEIAACNNTVVGFQGGGIAGLTGLTGVNDAVVQLGNAITSTINLQATMSLLSPVDSTSVGITFLFLQPNINLLLANLVTKRDQFDSAAAGLIDTRGLIHDQIVNQGNASLALGNGLINLLDPTLKGIAVPINDQIQSNFSAAIQQYEGRSGVIKVPTALVPTVSNLLASIGPLITGFLGSTANGTSGMSGLLSSLGARDDSQYCCGITQAEIDALGPDENDLKNVPGPVIALLESVGVLSQSAAT